MKTTLILSLSLAVGLFAAACQKQASNDASASGNTSTSQVNMGHDMSNMEHDMSNMQGHDMSNMNSDPNAAEQPYDLQYLDSMIHHHRGAIHMANMVLGKTKRPELKAFAQKIIDDQSKEIDFMNGLVVDKGRERGVPTPVSAAAVDMIHEIERGARKPAAENLGLTLRRAGV